MAPNNSPASALAAAPQLLDVAQAAELTGLPTRTVRHMFDTRAFPLVRVGTRALRVWSTDLAAYLDAQTIPAREGVTR